MNLTFFIVSSLVEKFSVGRLNGTRSMVKAMGPGIRRRKWVGEGSRRRQLGRERKAVSKDGKVDQFHE
jgi:hypothetical protein